jgi:hypothetical protein
MVQPVTVEIWGPAEALTSGQKKSVQALYKNSLYKKVRGCFFFRIYVLWNKYIYIAKEATPLLQPTFLYNARAVTKNMFSRLYNSSEHGSIQVFFHVYLVARALVTKHTSLK